MVAASVIAPMQSATAVWGTTSTGNLEFVRSLGATPIDYTAGPFEEAERMPESELLPMARAFDLATLAWSPLGGGILTGKYRANEAKGRKTEGGGPIRPEGERERPIVDAVLRIAGELGTTPSQVALAWVRQQRGLIIPILGARTLSQLEDNLRVLDLHLSHCTFAPARVATTLQQIHPD